MYSASYGLESAAREAAERRRGDTINDAHNWHRMNGYGGAEGGQGGSGGGGGGCAGCVFVCLLLLGGLNVFGMYLQGELGKGSSGSSAKSVSSNGIPNVLHVPTALDLQGDWNCGSAESVMQITAGANWIDTPGIIWRTSRQEMGQSRSQITAPNLLSIVANWPSDEILIPIGVPSPGRATITKEHDGWRIKWNNGPTCRKI